MDTAHQGRLRVFLCCAGKGVALRRHYINVATEEAVGTMTRPSLATERRSADALVSDLKC